MSLDANANRFSGFADLYDAVRPVPPAVLADVISTYLYRVGLVSNNLSYAAAIGLFQALIGLVMVLSANFISRRVVGASLW